MLGYPLHQRKHESFCKFFVRYGDFLPYGHGLKKWQLGLTLYKSLNDGTRDFVDNLHYDTFLYQEPFICLNFFRWLAKHNFKKELSDFPPFDIPLAYPFDHNAYGDTPIGDEVEATTNVQQCIKDL